MSPANRQRGTRKRRSFYNNIPASELLRTLELAVNPIRDGPQYDLEKLLHYRASEIDVNAPLDNYGMTALSIAVSVGGLKNVEILLSHGANPNPPALDWARNPLALASASDAVRIMRALLEHGANPNFQDQDEEDVYLGRTPLMFAKSREAIMLLLEAGADPCAEDASGKTFLSYLAVSDIYENLLKYYGYDSDEADYYYDEFMLFLQLEMAKKHVRAIHRGFAAAAA